MDLQEGMDLSELDNVMPGLGPSSGEEDVEAPVPSVRRRTLHVCGFVASLVLLQHWSVPPLLVAGFSYSCVWACARIAGDVHGRHCRMWTFLVVAAALCIVHGSLVSALMAIPLLVCPEGWLWWAPKAVLKRPCGASADSVRKRPAKAVSAQPPGGSDQRQGRSETTTSARKRPAAAMTPATDETPAGEDSDALAPGPGKRKSRAGYRQSYCKYGCLKRSGTKKLAQSGCQGMCWKCAKGKGTM